MATTNSKPIRYTPVEWDQIVEVRNRTVPKLSVSEIQRRAIRWYVPKILSGEIPISDKVVLLPAQSGRAKSTKKSKKFAVPA